jgi:hypothetical protein
MAAYSKYDIFVQHLCDKVHDFFGTNDTINVILCSDAPVVATDATAADRTQVANGGGYLTDGGDTQNDSTRTGGTVTETAVDFLWTASTGFGPFRYVDRINMTATLVTKPLVNYWDYGSSISLLAGETFLVDFGASVSTLT